MAIDDREIAKLYDEIDKYCVSDAEFIRTSIPVFIKACSIEVATNIIELLKKHEKYALNIIGSLKLVLLGLKNEPDRCEVIGKIVEELIKIKETSKVIDIARNLARVAAITHSSEKVLEHFGDLLKK